MAAISVAKRATLLFRRSILPGREGFVSVRALSVTSGKRKEESFFSTLFGSQVEKPTDAHSKVLTEKETLYEFEFNDVKPECIEDYVGLVSEFLPKISEDDQFPGELVGAWTTMFGRLDQAIHFWKYRGGFNSVMKAKQYVRENKEYLEFARKRRTMLNNRETQLLHEFTFFGEPEARAPSHIYELRTYHLKKIRQNMWNRPGWDTCVANTVPLIRRMESRIMIPLPFGPLQ
ncbi:hypothetical protein pdam_00013918 [Pocillopora damicornis]|uniref:NIPSNAP domain-containing protein n=1 Tax=Pocillopora damicornis TaxID=46731 RepID=A0A3M6UBH1_POCDA|nr:hypothetical protein pdam_00013918 [Pocillopora damicornis]